MVRGCLDPTNQKREFSEVPREFIATCDRIAARRGNLVERAATNCRQVSLIQFVALLRAPKLACATQNAYPPPSLNLGNNHTFSNLPGLAPRDLLV